MMIDRTQIGPLFRGRQFDSLREIFRAEPSWFEGAILGLLFNSAARSSDFEAMQFVLDIGYDINDVSYTGTPLSRASSEGSIAVIEWLQAHGAKTDESSLSTNPLFSAIQSGQAHAVRFFLAQGVDPLRRYPCGRNALDFARVWNDPAVIAELGGDPDWKRPPWVRCSIPDLTGRKPSVEMLAGVELELGFKMPDSLKQFLLRRFPDALFFADAIDSDDWHWLGRDHKFFHTARSLIAYNCDDPTQHKKKRKYQGYVVIGTDGSGNDWCLRTESTDLRVWTHDHEAEEFLLAFDSIDEFAEAMCNEFGESP